MYFCLLPSPYSTLLVLVFLFRFRFVGTVGAILGCRVCRRSPLVTVLMVWRSPRVFDTWPSTFITRGLETQDTDSSLAFHYPYTCITVCVSLIQWIGHALIPYTQVSSVLAIICCSLHQHLSKFEHNEGMVVLAWMACFNWWSVQQTMLCVYTNAISFCNLYVNEGELVTLWLACSSSCCPPHRCCRVP